MSAYQTVGIGECQCPGTPHPDGDEVGLRPKLGLAAGVSIQRAVTDFLLTNDRRREDDMLGLLVEGYVIHGVAEWNLVNEAGAIPVNEATIREQLLDDFARARPVADKADELYKEPILGPLLKAGSNSSRATSTNGSMSVTRGSTTKTRKRSKPSSTSTSATGSTETTTS